MEEREAQGQTATDALRAAAHSCRCLLDRSPFPLAYVGVVDVAKGLEGLKRSDGIHAAAVVITKNALTDYLPVQRKPAPGGKARTPRW